jgi:alpha-amylase
MNWKELKATDSLQQVLKHYQKLGQFRAKHPSVGAGKHELISEKPFLFTRTFENQAYTDRVLIGMDLKNTYQQVDVSDIFTDSTTVIDFYTGKRYNLENGSITLKPENGIILLEAE